MQTSTTCPSISSTNITIHSRTSSRSINPNACIGSVEKNNTNTNIMVLDEQQEEMVNWFHSCPYCNKSFKSPQALGGHQSAHHREGDADRKEYLARRRAQRMVVRTIMVADHHNGRSTVPMIPYGASIYGSSSSARGYGYRLMGSCPHCRGWFNNQQQQAAPIEYKFIPPYEANFLGGIKGSLPTTSSSSSPSGAAMIVLNGEKHELDVNMSTKQERLDLTLRL